MHYILYIYYMYYIFGLFINVGPKEGGNHRSKLKYITPYRNLVCCVPRTSNFKAHLKERQFGTPTASQGK